MIAYRLNSVVGCPLPAHDGGLLETPVPRKHPDLPRTLPRHRKLPALRFLSLLAAIVPFSLVWSTPVVAEKPIVTAYVFTQGLPLDPSQVDARKLTRVNYAFANIEQGRIVE